MSTLSVDEAPSGGAPPVGPALRLEGELTIYRAAELKAQLLAHLASCTTHMEIDLSEVTEIDSAGVQLLMLAQRSALARGCELRLSGHSQAMREAFSLLELGAHFGEPWPAGAPT